MSSSEIPFQTYPLKGKENQRKPQRITLYEPCTVIFSISFLQPAHHLSPSNRSIVHTCKSPPDPPFRVLFQIFHYCMHGGRKVTDLFNIHQLIDF